MELLSPEKIVQLTRPERLALIAQVWDSLGHDDLPLTDGQKAELEHRLASLNDDRRSGVTWAILKAELERLQEEVEALRLVGKLLKQKTPAGEDPEVRGKIIEMPIHLA